MPSYVFGCTDVDSLSVLEFASNNLVCWQSCLLVVHSDRHDLVDGVLAYDGLSVCQLRYEVANNHYLSGIGNVSLDCDSFQTIGQGRVLWGVGAGYGWNTIVGPLKAQIFWSSLTKKAGFYLSFGYHF